MLKLTWRYKAGQYGQLVKVSCERGALLAEHSHDYSEIFWLEEGVCLHRINGIDERLERGDLVFIRMNKDRHQLSAIGRQRFTMTNLECHPDILRQLQSRYPEPFGHWFSTKQEMPLKMHLEGGRLNQLQRSALDYAACSPDMLHTEAFLLDIVRGIEPPPLSLPGLGSCPDWLRNALLKSKEQEIFTQGVAGMARESHRSPEHLTRSCQKYLGQTPRQIIERYRMEHAERLLRLTSDTVIEIAYSCGYSTTAQFYRAFRRHYETNPLAYRRWLNGDLQDSGEKGRLKAL